jgi:putative ABC transport system permease protein
MSSVADAAYRLLLRALPADLRDSFGPEMERLFRDHRRASSGRLLRLASLWVAAVGDVATTAVAARVSARRCDSDRSPSRWSQLVRAFISDFRFGFRLLRRYPSTSLVAITTLALGIGANAAIFSVVDAVMVRQLPYVEPDRLVKVWEKRPAENVLNNIVAPADFVDWKARQTPFERIAAFIETQLTLTGQGEPRRVGVGAVTPEFFDVMRVPAAAGRTFRTGDDEPGKNLVVVLTHGLWQRVFGGDRSLVGRTITLNGAPFEVIGVLPASFRFPNPSLEIWAPITMQSSPERPLPRASHQFDVYARLKPGVTLAQARDAMDRLGKEIEAEHPDTNKGHGAWVSPLRDEFVGPVQTQLVVLFGAVGLVLLIACVNVANLLLALAASRRREMAVRAALGASRGRLIVQTLAESLTLAAAGGLAGLALALAIAQALPLVLPEQMSVVTIASVGLDVRVLLFACGITGLTGVLFGLPPALSASRPDLIETVKEGGRGAAGVRKYARRALVIAEVTLATLTLVSGGLIMRSFASILAQPLGFDARNRLTFQISIPGAGYATSEHRRLALDDLEQRLATIPGVAAVGAINLLPLGGGNSRIGMGFEQREPVPGEGPTRMHPRIVTAGYFKAMGIPIVNGRGFTADDHPKAEPVAIVSDPAVRRFWPGGNPIGQRVRFGGDETWRRIVGIAGDVKHWGRTRDVEPTIYWPQTQAASSSLTFVVATNVEPTSIAGAVRAQVAAVDPKLPIGQLQAMDAIVSQSMRSERAQTILMAVFALLGLTLAVIGIYGVMAQLVTARIPEIGVRMTLGARPADILRQFLAEGFWQAAAGVIVGLIAGVYLMKLAETLLFSIKPWDPITLASVAALLLAAAIAACLVPATRAMRTDPVQALRQ